MKAMPFSFEQFQVLDFSSASDSSLSSFLLHHQQPQKWTKQEDYCYVGFEPTSVLDSTTRRSPSPSPSPPTSSSTMSSSLGSSNNTTSSSAPENPPLETSTEKCGIRMEDWEGQDQSILRLIMGDVEEEDPSLGFNKLLHNTSSASHNVDFSSGFAALDNQALNLETSSGNYPGFPFIAENIDTKPGSVSVSESNLNNPLLVSPGGFHSQQEFGMIDEKPQVINPNPQFMVNQNQVEFSENPSFFVPLMYPQMQEQQVFSHEVKRPIFDPIGQNYQVPRLPLLDSGQEMFARRQQQQNQLPLFPHHLHQQQQQPFSPAAKQHNASHQLQQSIFDQLYKSAEMIEAGNPVQAQGILARLNHQLSPIGKPFQRAAFYMKEALQLLLHSNIHNFLAFSPISFIFKLGAFKSFSEISPVLQFANFTSNQVLFEAVERFDTIHIIDFDIGFGVQWSSFMQELALRSGNANTTPSLKVTAVVSPSTCDEIELNFTRESLIQYAKDINMSFELNIMSIESLNPPSFPSQLFDNNEAIAVNMPISCFASHPSLFPSVLHFVKQLRPKVVVTLDRNCDRIDVPLPTNVVHVLQCYSALLESLDAVNVNLDVLQKIERHFIQPSIKKTILGPNHSQEKLPPWRNMFLQSGFSPFTFSNFTEAQAECLVQRAPVRGFHVERKPSSLLLCWQRKELVSVSTWRC